MHKSRLSTLVIDCEAENLEVAEAFWGKALGYGLKHRNEPGDENYTQLDSPAEELKILLQRVDHPSRVHLDIETDDIEAEVSRLESLGAKKIAQIKRWWVMEAPTGHRFCVVRPQRSGFDEDANVWE